MKTDIAYTAEIRTAEHPATLTTIYFSSSPTAAIGTIYEQHPGCQIVRYWG